MNQNSGSIEEKSLPGDKAGTGNLLFPVFLKLEKLAVLLVGGGNVAFEKITAMLANAPGARITVVAEYFIPAFEEIPTRYPAIVLEHRSFQPADLQGKDIAIIAINDIEKSRDIAHLARELNLLINVADTPALCDFYLGSIVQKGDLKIAISTNGKSPTVAKRLREAFTELIPGEIDDVLQNMSQLRQTLSGDFNDKVQALNKVTHDFRFTPPEITEEIVIAESRETVKVLHAATSWGKKYLLWLGLILACGIGIYLLFSFGLVDDGLRLLTQDGHIFYWMLLVGFTAEIVAGSMGMGYGVICTTILLMLNIPPPIVSASIHSAESFTTAAGSISHFKLGNVNKKLTRSLAIPAILGAIIGALALSYFGEKYAKATKPFIAAYTMYLGIRILTNAFKKKGKKITRRNTNYTSLGLIGGFIDSFGGGGWGPMVTGTLIKNGRTPRYVIGSSTVAKFMLTVTSAITFLFTVGSHHWNIVAGLLLGGIITAPFSAMLTSRLPMKKMFVIVGVLVIIMSLITIYRGLFL